MKWIYTKDQDSTLSINVEAISYVIRKGHGCTVRTMDGTDHNFLQVSYEDMMEEIYGV